MDIVARKLRLPGLLPEIVSEYDQEIPQSQTADNPVATITRHQEDKSSKATSSLFPIKMIAMLEWRLYHRRVGYS